MSAPVIEIDITDLAFDGKAVGHLDGKVVFLNGGLPGERVRAQITRNKPRYSEARVLEIISKAPIRVPAICSHFEYCGGCTWQDLGYKEQLQFKKKQVKDCLEHLGGLPEVEAADVIGSTEVFHYRNKMEFSFHAEAEEPFTLGLHKRGAFDQIFDVHECHICPQVMAEIVVWMRRFVADNSIPVYDVRRHTGFMRFLMLRQAKKGPGLMVNIVTHYGEIPHGEEMISGLTSAFPAITTIVHNQNGQKSNIATGERERVLFGAGYIEETLYDTAFRIHPNSFFQTNSLQAEVLYRTAFEMLAPHPTDRVFDLYCGGGAIGILLAPRVSSVVGVELVHDAVLAAQENAAANRITNISFVEQSVTDFLIRANAEQDRPEITIIDPPRAGLHPKALKQLLKLAPDKILYISCNPATFARDAKEMVAAGYQLPKVQPVDMFPHTMHIELAAAFIRN